MTRLGTSRRRSAVAVIAVGVAALALSACSGSSGTAGEATSAASAAEEQSSVATGEASAAATEAASTEACTPSDQPVELNYWTWGAGYEDAAKLWNATNPNIQVKFSDMPVGNAGGYQKVMTAIKAGNAPDVVFLEFDTVPAFFSEGVLENLTPLIGSEAQAQFVPAIAAQVDPAGDGSMYAAPLGSGPMALFYRKDLFDKNGIAVPTTWDEFAAAAVKVHSLDPESYLVNFDGGGNANWFAGLASQDNAQWFGSDGASWNVSVNGAESTNVAQYWQDLLTSKGASSLATFSPEWSAALAQGNIWTWPSAVWGAGVIQATAPDLSGKWAVAPLPTWGSDAPASASWGGGGLGVLNTTDHPCEAAQFALWMGTNVEAMKILNKAIGIYPTTESLLSDPIFSEPQPYFGDQPIFEVFKTATEGLANFRWGPSMTDTYKAVTDAFVPALAAGGDGLADSLNVAQESIVTAMQRQGFEVSQ